MLAVVLFGTQFEQGRQHSPRVAERYYIHVTEPHVMSGFERFLNYHASKLVDTAPNRTDKLQ